MESRIQEAQLRKAVADAQRAEAQARKARYDALDSTAGSRPGGRTAADGGSGYPATLAAYRAMVDRAADIAREVEKGLAPGEGARVLIVDSLDFCGPDVQAIQVSAQLDSWLEKLDGRIAVMDRMLQQMAEKVGLQTGSILAAVGSAAAAAAAAGELAAVAADVMGYLRGGYDLGGQAVTLPDASLQALVAGRLDRQRCTVFLPTFCRLEAAGPIPVIEKLNECIRRRDRLASQVAALRGLSPGKRGQGQETGTGDGEKDSARASASGVEAACKSAELLTGEFAAFNEALTSPTRSGGHPPLAAAALRQCLDRMRITHLLYLGVASSGGDMVLGRGLFGSGKAGYLGGCVVTYVLARTSGEILAADTIAGHSSLKYDLGANDLSGPLP